MKRCRQFRLQPYDAPVMIVLTDDIGKVAKDWVGLENIHEKAAAIALNKNAAYLMAFRPGHTSMSNIVHECGHVVGYIMRDYGIGFDPDNSEPFCYMLQHLFDMTLEQLVKMKAKITHR